MPRSRCAPGLTENKVLAHRACNERKADRMPHPCEVLFGQVTAEIAASLGRRGRKAAA